MGWTYLVTCLLASRFDSSRPTFLKINWSTRGKKLSNYHSLSLISGNQSCADFDALHFDE